MRYTPSEKNVYAMSAPKIRFRSIRERTPIVIRLTVSLKLPKGFRSGFHHASINILLLIVSGITLVTILKRITGLGRRSVIKPNSVT